MHDPPIIITTTSTYARPSPSCINHGSSAERAAALFLSCPPLTPLSKQSPSCNKSHTGSAVYVCMCVYICRHIRTYLRRAHSTVFHTHIRTRLDACVYKHVHIDTAGIDKNWFERSSITKSLTFINCTSSAYNDIALHVRAPCPFHTHVRDYSKLLLTTKSACVNVINVPAYVCKRA